MPPTGSGSRTAETSCTAFCRKRCVSLPCWLALGVGRVHVAELTTDPMPQRLSGASLLVFVNKTDVHGCMDDDEILAGLRLQEIRTHHWQILRCSAMTGANLKEGLAWVVEDAKARLFLY